MVMGREGGSTNAECRVAEFVGRSVVGRSVVGRSVGGGGGGGGSGGAARAVTTVVEVLSGQACGGDSRYPGSDLASAVVVLAVIARVRRVGVATVAEFVCC
jgi:hypothetical protein